MKLLLNLRLLWSHFIPVTPNSLYFTPFYSPQKELFINIQSYFKTMQLHTYRTILSGFIIFIYLCTNRQTHNEQNVMFNISDM